MLSAVMPSVIRMNVIMLSVVMLSVIMLKGVGKTTLTFSVSVNVLSANFPFWVVPAGREGGGNGKYFDVSGKR